MPTEFCSPRRLISKKDTEKAMLVVHYRSINGMLERPAFIIMTPHEVKSSMKEDWNVFFSTDMTSVYFQIPLDDESRELTTFIIP